MHKALYLFFLFQLFCGHGAWTHPPLRDPSGYFAAKKFYIAEEQIVTDPLALQQVARKALRYIARHQKDRPYLTDPQPFRKILPLENVKETLQFVVDTIEEDKASGNFRILDPEFLNKNFSCITWHADEEEAARHHVALPNDGRIRLTSYAVFATTGRRHKTKKYHCALYQLLNDKMANKFTKQQVLAGALEKSPYKNRCKPLAWVTRQGLEDALMHGTILVTFPDSNSKLLNVHKNNGVTYNRKIKTGWSQKRYWYFQELAGDANVQAHRVENIKVRKHVVVAGDLRNIGFGKLVALRHSNPITGKSEMMLACLTDTGGAFQGNFYQLDLFGGLVTSKQMLDSIIKQLPNYTRASILYRI